MRWHVLGVGAVGCFLAHKLQGFSGLEILLLFRDRNSLARYTHAESQLRLTEQSGKTSCISFPAEAVESSSPVHTPRDIEVLLVCTKATQTVSAVRSIRDRLCPNKSLVLFFQNGLGIREQVLSSMPDLQPSLVMCSLSYGIFLDTGLPFSAHTPGSGGQLWLPPSSQVSSSLYGTVLEVFKSPRVGLNIVEEKNMEKRLFLKGCVNAVINPLAGILDVTNGALLESEFLRQLVLELCVRTLTSGTPSGLCRNFARVSEGLGSRNHRQTSGNVCSMLQDMRRGARESEIDYVNGYLVERAAQLGCPPLPLHRTLLR